MSRNSDFSSDDHIPSERARSVPLTISPFNLASKEEDSNSLFSNGSSLNENSGGIETPRSKSVPLAIDGRDRNDYGDIRKDEESLDVDSLYPLDQSFSFFKHVF